MAVEFLNISNCGSGVPEFRLKRQAEIAASEFGAKDLVELAASVRIKVQISIIGNQAAGLFSLFIWPSKKQGMPPASFPIAKPASQHRIHAPPTCVSLTTRLSCAKFFL
jgi:hypothetical protein